MAEAAPNYRKIQALLVITIFGCIIGAALAPSPLLAAGAILGACALCLVAARLEPEAPPDEHHH